MPPPLYILSEPSVASYGTIGRLYRDTFRAMALRATHLPCPDRVPALPPGAIVLHNVLGFRFAPLPGVRNIAVPFHEWDRYPAAWAARLNDFDEVWAATGYLARVLQRSGVQRPIRVLPPALDVRPPLARTAWTPAAPFRFLFVGEPHFRKGHHLLLEGFRRLRLSPARATLTIKTSADCAWTVAAAGVRLIAERWTTARMRRLYAAHDAFVSASLAEGLGLGVAEAVLARLPVATNRWGGHTALLTPGGYVRIPHRVVPQPFCSRPDFYAPGQRCALSSADAVANAMEALLTMAPRERRAQAMAASAWLRRHFGLAACAPRLRQGLFGRDEQVPELSVPSAAD